MNIAIQVPEDVASRLRDRWSDPSRRALEAVALEAYREGVLTAAEVGRMLGFASRWETEGFLKEAAAHLDYTAADLQNDAEAVRRTLDS